MKTKSKPTTIDPVKALKKAGFTPYYNSGGIVIYHADSLQLLDALPPDSVDIAMTSPPYNTLGNRIPKEGSGSMLRSKFVAKINQIGYSDDLPEYLYQAWLNYAVALSLRACRGLVWVNHKNRYRDGAALHPARMMPFDIHSEIIWARAGGFAFNCRRHCPSHEHLLSFGRPHYWDKVHDGKMSVWKITQVRNRTDHPCPFPVELARRPIESSCPPGGWVVDPFSGSATVGVACQELGRRFIGVEREERFCEVAATRLEATRRDVSQSLAA